MFAALTAAPVNPLYCLSPSSKPITPHPSAKAFKAQTFGGSTPTSSTHSSNICSGSSFMEALSPVFCFHTAWLKHTQTSPSPSLYVSEHFHLLHPSLDVSSPPPTQTHPSSELSLTVPPHFSEGDTTSCLSLGHKMGAELSRARA